MVRLFFKWLVMAATILALPHLMTGFEVQSLGTALALALVLGVLNTVLKPLLVVLTLPFTILTFGLFLWVINGIVFWVSAQTVSGVFVENFRTAFLASLAVSFVSWVFSWSVKKEGGKIYWRFEKQGTPAKKGPAIDLEQDSSGRWT